VRSSGAGTWQSLNSSSAQYTGSVLVKTSCSGSVTM
jgi:hypothetical protein